MYKRKEIIGNCTLYLGDCLEVMPTLDKVDAVITDPPYMIGISDFDTRFDVEKSINIIYKILPKDAFFIYFGQMPTIIEFFNCAKIAGFTFKDHVVWVKRTITAIFLDLLRTHESIFIHKKGNPKINNNKGNYSDVKVEMLHTMPEYITGIKRVISDLRNGGTQFRQGKTRCQKDHKHYQVGDVKHSRSAEYVNFTNVWSFLPENHANVLQQNSVNHATVKPIKLMERLIDFACDMDNLILDPFMGSGSTLVACAKTGRHGIGIEIDEDYFNIACRRVEEAYRQGDLFV